MKHIPVLLAECIDGLNIKPDGIYIDGSTGRGGHAREVVKKLQTGRLIAIDRDAEAIEETRELLTDYNDRITYIHGNFKDIPVLLDELGINHVDGMLFDLGVSSPHLDDENNDRGFSYMKSSRLDMRMDKSEVLTAYEVVNTRDEEELKNILFKYGEERYAAKIARAIVRERIKTPIETTFDLNEIIMSAIPAAARREPQHPCKRSYQALRIVTNDELGALKQMLETAPDRLRTGGRICIVSFHSLESRAVKTAFAAHSAKCICPDDFPVCVCSVKPKLKLITRKAIKPQAEEISGNARARSAELRIAQRM